MKERIGIRPKVFDDGALLATLGGDPRNSSRGNFYHDRRAIRACDRSLGKFEPLGHYFKIDCHLTFLFMPS